jgi:hypothetical protein
MAGKALETDLFFASKFIPWGTRKPFQNTTMKALFFSDGD